MVSRNISALLVAFTGSVALAVNFPNAGGDIASNGAGGWNETMPGPTEKAQFNQAGTYIASADVQFGEFSVQANSTFDIAGSGNHTIKIGNFSMAYYNRRVTLVGGLWDLGGRFAACNELGAHTATVTLSGGCVVTNATDLRVAYRTANNAITVTDSSRVYADGVALAIGSTSCNIPLTVSSGGSIYVKSGNFLDTSAVTAAGLIEADTTNRIVITGPGSKIVCPARLQSSDPRGFVVGNVYGRNSLEVSEGGELVAPFRFGLGYSDKAKNNTAVFKTGARFSLSDMRVGENGSCGNKLSFLSGAEGTFSTGYVGGYNGAGSGNRVVIDGANVSCRQLIVSRNAGSVSNELYIAGADTCFTTTVTDLPRYPLVSNGKYNTFTLDGATWNYWLNIQIDLAASSNAINIVNGGQLNMGGGLFSGTNDVASCGNRIFVANGAVLSGTFVEISREDNVMTVSNATVNVQSSNARYGDIAFGVAMMNVKTIGRNGLNLRGNSPCVVASGPITFEKGSFLDFEVPEGGYETAPLNGKALLVDETSAMSVRVGEWAKSLERGTNIVLAVTRDGVTIPSGVLQAANDSLALQTANKARLRVSSDGKDLSLRVNGNEGLLMILR